MFNQDRSNGKFAEVDVVKNLINKANSVNIQDVCKNYNIDVADKKIICPFYFHQNGRERSPSFYFYLETNSFNCFGCKSGGGPVEFVSLYEEITKYEAAKYILNNYYSSDTFEPSVSVNTYKTCIEFSHLIREFISNHKDNQKAVQFGEYLCSVFDNINRRYALDEVGYKKLFNTLNSKLKEFKV